MATDTHRSSHLSQRQRAPWRWLNYLLLSQRLQLHRAAQLCESRGNLPVALQCEWRFAEKLNLHRRLSGEAKLRQH